MIRRYWLQLTGLATAGACCALTLAGILVTDPLITGILYGTIAGQWLTQIMLKSMMAADERMVRLQWQLIDGQDRIIAQLAAAAYRAGKRRAGG